MDAYSLGEHLREARETAEIDIEEAVAQLRIRRSILEGFEAGEFAIEDTPAVQVRGLLRNYARYLGLDEEHVLQLYEQMRVAKSQKRRSRRGRRRAPKADDEPAGKTQPLLEVELVERRRSGCRRLWRLLLLSLASAAALAIIAFVSVQLLGEATQEAARPSASPVPPSATASASATATAAPSATESGERSQYTGSGILVSILLTQESWLNVARDGEQQFSGIAPAQTLLEYEASNDVSLSAGNALALDIIWNGQRQGQIGERGQRVFMRFSADGVELQLGPGAEASASPIPSATVAPTLAPATVAPSVTPIPRNGGAEASASPLASEPAPSATSIRIATSSPTVAPASQVPAPFTATATATEDLTVILPPRVTQAGLPPQKSSGGG